MILRREQQEAFEADAFGKMRDRIAAHVRQQHPSEAKHLDDAQLKTEVERGMRRAVRYSLTRETSIGAFVSLRFVIGPQFDQQPRIHAALSESSLSPDQRMDTLMERTSPDDWADAMNPHGI